jgi:hypothetical protein
MGKFLIGVATAALWFALSHAANAAALGPGADVQAPGVSVRIGR